MCLPQGVDCYENIAWNPGCLIACKGLYVDVMKELAYESQVVKEIGILETKYESYKKQFKEDITQHYLK